MLLISIPTHLRFLPTFGGHRDFPKESALAIITGSCINKVDILKNKNFMLQRCLLAQEIWQAKSSCSSSSLFMILIISPGYLCIVRLKRPLFLEPAIDGFNCLSLFRSGSVLSLRCADQSCLCNFTNKDILWFCVKGKLLCFSLNPLLEGTQYFVFPFLSQQETRFFSSVLCPQGFLELYPGP